MEEMIYTLLKEKKTEDLIREINANESLLDFEDKNGASLLLLSTYFGNKELQLFLLSRKKALTIFEAAACGSIDEVRKLLNKDPSLINAIGRDGFPSLGLASYFGHENIVKMLLELGADPNIASKNSLNVAPLHAAISSKNFGIAKLLLEHGADVNAKQQHDFTPLHGAAHNGDFEMLKLLLAHGADKNLLTVEKKSALDFAREINNTKVESFLADK